MNLYSDLALNLQSAQIWTRDRTVLPVTHTRTIPDLSLLPSRKASPPLSGTRCADPQRDTKLSN